MWGVGGEELGTGTSEVKDLRCLDLILQFTGNHLTFFFFFYFCQQKNETFVYSVTLCKIRRNVGNRCEKQEVDHLRDWQFGQRRENQSERIGSR